MLLYMFDVASSRSAVDAAVTSQPPSPAGFRVDDAGGDNGRPDDDTTTASRHESDAEETQGQSVHLKFGITVPVAY